MDEQWKFEGGQWIVSNKGERIAQVYNWHAGYLERGERIAILPQLELQNAAMLTALEICTTTLQVVYKADPSNISAKVCIERNQEVICKAKETGK